MDIFVIVLGIALIILTYILYLYLYPSATLLASNTSLITASTPVTSIANPASLRYAYGVWVFVSSWDSTTQKVIFSRNNNLSLYLGQTQPKLNLDVYMNDGSTTNVMITDNFPLQKWTYVIISLDNQFVDAYMDGKLVVSQKLSGIPATPSNDTTAFPVLLGGNTRFDATISRFMRWIKPVDPQTAWNYYMAGNGSGVTRFLSSYGAYLGILKDNILTSKVKLF